MNKYNLYKPITIFALLLFVSILNVSAETSDGEAHKEEDGFEWVEINDGTGEAVAKNMDGEIIVSPKLKCNFIHYRVAKDGPFSIGYFRLVHYTKDYKERDALCDIKGNVIIPFKHYDYVSISVRVIDADTLAYISASGDNLKTYDIYALNGKKIASNVKNFNVDDSGNFIDWDTKRSLGIRIPKVNWQQLSNFHLKQSEKKVKTSLGFYDVQEMDTDGFKWHLLYTCSLCAAQTVDGNLIVPVESKCKEIKYDNGFFIGKTKDNIACVYSKDGKIIIPASYGCYAINIDVNTKKYFVCAVNDCGDNNISLYDLEGNLVFPEGTYSSITPKKVNDKILFIVSTDGKSYVLDFDKELLLCVDKPCFVSDICEDRLGLYYKILHNENVGIIDDNGNLIIAPGRYDLIKRVANDEVAYYETTIIRGNGIKDTEYLHGICDLEGNEVLPNKYSVIYCSNTDVLEMEEGGMRHRINIARIINDAKVHRNKQTAYAQAITENAPQDSQQLNTQSPQSSNSGSKYAPLGNPELVDNSEKIAEAHRLIAELESQKRNCSACHGTGSVCYPCTMCHGTGIRKIGYMTPQYYTCNWCQGTGKEGKQCISCAQKDRDISLANSLLETLQETHGMTREALDTYTDIKSWEHNQNMQHQRAIDEIAQPYLDGTRKSNSPLSTSGSASSSKNCSYCGGTGVSKVGISGSGGVGVAYTNASGEKCPYCDRYDFHHHDRCGCTY